jgi:penicillin-binding protein 1C
LDGVEGRALFQLAHRSSSSTVFWHLDGNYVGSTKKTHQFSLAAGFGSHSMTLVDDQGEIFTFSFKVLSNP